MVGDWTLGIFDCRWNILGSDVFMPERMTLFAASCQILQRLQLKIECCSTNFGCKILTKMFLFSTNTLKSQRILVCAEIWFCMK